MDHQSRSPKTTSKPPPLIPAKIHLLAAALLLLVAWLAFANTLDNGFVWDDHELVVRNPDVRAGSIAQIFSSGAWAFQQPENNNYYRPLQILTYRAIAALAGMSPLPFHAVNLALHFAVVLLVYAIFFKLLKLPIPAFVGACLFAVHPIHTEAIDWIACSTELGCALFLMLAFYCYLCDWRIASWAAFFAALLWKEMAAPLPLLIAAHALLVERTSLKKTVPYWLVLAGYLVLRRNALGVLYAAPVNWTLSPSQFVLTMLKLAGTYCWKLILPLSLNAYHVSDQLSIWPVLLLLAVYGFRRLPLPLFGCAWVLLALLPVLNVYHLGSNVFGERYLYIPSAGFCLILAWLASRHRALPVGIAVAVIASLYIAQDRARAADWTDDFTLFSKTVQQSPNSAVVQNLYAGLLRIEKNDLPAAQQHYLAAIEAAKAATPPQISQISIAYTGLAHVYDDTHQPEKALAALDEAQRINPRNSEAQVARAVILAEQSNWPAAKHVLQQILSADPNNAVALNTMGMVAWQGEHNNQAAIALFERALTAGGSNVTAASVHNNLGAVFGEQKQLDRALAEFHDASELDPNNPEYPTNLGNVFGMQGKKPDAEASFRRALEIAPGYPPALAGLNQLR